MDAPARGPAPTGPPAALVRAGRLVAVEGVALTLLGVGYAAQGVRGAPEDRLATVLAGLFALVVGAALVPVGRALERGRSWALSPTVVVQVLVVVVGVGLVQGSVLLAGVPLLLLGGVVLYLCFTPESREVFRGTA